MKSIAHDFSKAMVLDVGCGTGFYFERWKELGTEKIVGIDIANIAIEKLTEQYPEGEFYQMDIGANIEGIASLKFDFVSAFDVLFHIVDDTQYEKAICNIYSLLNPGGFFVWSDNFLHKETLRAEHQVCRRLNSISAILISTGFQIVERCPMFYLMNAPVDSRNRFLEILWRIIRLGVSRSEFAGLAIGGFLYPFELVLTSLANEGPSTEIMICRRPI